MENLDILAIEDDPADVDLIREAFKPLGADIRLHPVNDGEEALRLLRSQEARPDLILLDLNLPKKDGREVLRELKSDPSLRSIPVVILTTSAADADVGQCYVNGANCYLTKPFGIDDFFALARRIERFWLRLARLPSRAAPRRA